MKIVRVLSVLLICCWIFSDASAQYRNKHLFIGVAVGATNYMGDLDDNFTIKFTRPGIGFLGGYRFNPHMSVRIAFAQGWVQAKDAVGAANYDDARWRRNLSFRSSITELAATVHYEFFATTRKYTFRPQWTPYIYAGIGLFYYNPQAKLAGKWYNLQPLGTEGQFLPGCEDCPKPYKLVQPAIPIGVGVRYKLTKQLDISVDVGVRKIFTDYLDDVSDKYPDLDALSAQNPVAALLSDRIDRTQFPQGAEFINGIRGHSGFGNQDWYIMSMVTATYILDWVKCPKFK